jgi:streptomycin 6-kinase
LGSEYGFELPGGLGWLRDTDAGRDWLAALPRLLRECVERWDLRVEAPFEGGYVSLPVAVRLPDGTPAVLKLQYPDRESEHEAAALAHWDGDGAIRLLAHDAERNALLLERCLPGTPLAELLQDEALDVFVELLPRLWKPAAAPFRPLAEEAAWWADTLPAVRELDGLSELVATQGEQVLVHQDLHAGNVLRAEREPWLVIDPKPLAGEREFGIAPIVRGRELGHSRRDVLYRLDHLTSELGLDRERARLWTAAQAVAWDWPEVAHWLLAPR